MLYRINPKLILLHHFSRVDTDGARTLSMGSLLIHGVFPTCVGCAAGLLAGPLVDPAGIAMAVAIFSLLATVLTAMISVIYAVLNQDQGPVPGPEQQFLRDLALQRLAAIRSLQSNVAFCVFVLLASLIPLVVLLADLPRGYALTLTLAVYSIAAMVAVSLVDIVVGVYDVLENEANEQGEKLKSPPT